MIAWFVRNPVAANFLLLLILALGLYNTSHFVPVEVVPTSELDKILIEVQRRGATPQEMESSVSAVVEESVADLEFVDDLTSSSGEETASIHIKLKSGTDRQKALSDVKSRVDALSNLPGDIERPIVFIPTDKHEVLTVVIYGDIDEQEMAIVANRLRDDIVRHDIASVARIEGLRPKQISVNVSDSRLREFQLTRGDIAAAINNQAIDLGAGQVKSSNGDIILRTSNRAYEHEDFHQIVLRRFEDGSTLLLGDIADIQDGFDESNVVARFNGHRAAFVDIYRVGNESAISVSDSVREFLSQERTRLPETVELEIFDDDARFVRQRLTTLLNSGLQGAVLVMILLGLFLHRTVAFWVVAGIPVCFAGALSLFPLMGISINIISLFSFILVLGVVVDDAIVTGENIYTHHSKGKHGVQAAIDGTHEVAVPVIFGVLTTMLVFVPMLMVEGEAASHAISIGGGVIAALVFSLIESKLILPAHLSNLKTKGAIQHNWLHTLDNIRVSAANSLTWVSERIYQPFLTRCLKHRYVTVVGFVCSLILIVSFIAFGWIRYNFMPEIVSEKIFTQVEFSHGTPIEKIHAVTDRIEEAAIRLRKEYQLPNSDDSLIDNIQTNIRKSPYTGSTSGWIVAEIDQTLIEEADFDSPEIANRWRELTGKIDGLEKLAFHATNADAMMPIQVKILSNNIDHLRSAVALTRGYLNGFSGVFDVGDTIERGKPELQIKLTPQAEVLGLSLNDVTRQVRNAFFGIQAQRIQRDQDDIRVMVKAPLSERNDLSDLDDLMIRTSSGNETRFSDIATVSWEQSSAKIDRIQQRRAATVSAKVDYEQVNIALLENKLSQYLENTLNQFPELSYQLGGNNEVEEEANNVLFYGLLGVLACIFGLLAIVFKSYVQPLIILSVIPFSLIGAIIGHLITGLSLSMFSIFGMLALVGVVINDSLVLVDWINRRLREGKDLWDVVNQAGAARFRAICLTSLTTFFGLLPILFQTNKGAQFLVPMAVSLGFGILFATIITLILVPCNYLILQDIKRLLRPESTPQTGTITTNQP